MRKMRKAKRLAIVIQLVRAQGLLPIWVARDSLLFHLNKFTQGQLVQMGGLPTCIVNTVISLHRGPQHGLKYARVLSIRDVPLDPVVDDGTPGLGNRFGVFRTRGSIKAGPLF